MDANNLYYDSRNNCNAIMETATNTLVVGCNNTIIPEDCLIIGQYAFQRCKGLTGTLTIPNSVQTIGQQAFYKCTGMTSITSLATTAPSVHSESFRNIKNGGTLYFPEGASGYDAWMSTSSYYLGRYNWTMQTISE